MEAARTWHILPPLHKAGARVVLGGSAGSLGGRVLGSGGWGMEVGELGVSSYVQNKTEDDPVAGKLLM